MFEITLTGAGKRYNRDWVFRGIDRTFQSGRGYVILGGNGSGKSTLIRALIGYTPLSEGNLSYHRSGRPLKSAAAYRHVSFCSPYLELYEELTLNEMARFHFSLKPPVAEVAPADFAAHIGLEHAADKAIHFFSSGMKQRVRIGLALLSDTPAVFLDEPTSNLDRRGEAWYGEMVDRHGADRLIVVASNHREAEYAFCTESIDIHAHKPPAPRVREG